MFALQTLQSRGQFHLADADAELLRGGGGIPALRRGADGVFELAVIGGTIELFQTLLQFDRRFWRKPSTPRAFGSPLDIGAGWEGNEEQRGKAGILSLLAGGAASDATAAVMDRDGIAGLTRGLDWLGASKATLVGWRQTRWEADPWSRGGYAVFDPSYTATGRGWLAQPCGRIVFAGEHTSLRWQGYMNGAVESGHRAAHEVRAAHLLATG